MHRSVALLGLSIGLSACATAGSDVETEHSAALRSGDPSGPPAIGVLPDVAKSSSSARVQQGLSLARQVLETRLPDPPADHSYQVLKLWIDNKVAPWVAARRDSVDEARFQFGLAHEEASVDERIVANAVIGLLQEDTAVSLTQIPAPTELDTEPEVAEIYRDLVQSQVQPFRDAALIEYRDCAKSANDEGRELHRWAVFCHGRGDRLQASR
jgi:hypothetical protein